jgi:cytochrome subunit of sulfide dehydrogenase
MSRRDYESWAPVLAVSIHGVLSRRGNMSITHARITLLALAGLVFVLPAGIARAANVEKLVAVCADCHGKAGASTEPEVPIIGGYSAEFLTNNIKGYKNKDRDCPETKFRTGTKKGTKTTMCQIVKDLTGAEIREIADYFAEQKFVRAKQKFDPVLAKRGKEVHDEYCEKCHSDGGTRSDDDAGMPAGQWIPYLQQAFDEFSTGKRPISKKMKQKMEQVDKDDISALIQFYASIQ